MSKIADLIQTVAEPMAYVTSTYCGTDEDEVYEGYFEWLCNGCDERDFAWEADWCIMCAIDLELDDARMLALKRAVLVGAALVTNDADALGDAMVATLAA